MDRVLMRVAVGREARWGSEEVLEGGDVDHGIKCRGRLESRRRRGGGSDGGDGGFDNGQGDVLKGDVFSRDVVDWAVGKLVLGPTVLSEWGKEDVKLGLSETDDFGGGFFELLKVKLGSGVKCFKGGSGSEWGWGVDDVGVGVNGGGLESVRVDEGNAGAC